MDGFFPLPRKPRYLRKLVALWLVIGLPLALPLLAGMNRSLLRQAQQEQDQLLAGAARQVETLLTQLRQEPVVDYSPASLQQALARQLPATAKAAWLRDADGRITPCLWAADWRPGTLPQPDADTLWTPLSLPQASWQLGIDFPPMPKTVHPLAGGSLLLALGSWALLLLLWRRAGEQEGELVRVTERFQQTLEFAGDALVVIDTNSGRIEQANGQTAALLGCQREEIYRLQLPELFIGPSRRRFHRLVEQVRRTGEGEAKELLIRRPDGSTFYGSVRARLGRLGRRTMVHGVLRDVTDTRLLDQELRRKNQDLLLLNHVARLLAESPQLEQTFLPLLESICQAFDAEGGGLYLARDGGGRLELAAELNLSPPVATAIRELSTGRCIIGQAILTGRPYCSLNLQSHPLLAATAVSSDGWRSLQAVPLSAKAEIVGVLVLFNRHPRCYAEEEKDLLCAVGSQVGTAVTWSELYGALNWQGRLTQASNRELERSRQQLREHLDRLEETNRTLERLDRMKNNFLAIASHELRTPLTYILPATELLRQQLQSRLDSEERELLEAVRQGGERLDCIVRDLLEMARIESRDVYLAREPLSLEQLFGELASEFAPALQQRGHRLLLPPLAPGLDLHGDYYHLKRAFSRLLENAIKFTPDGGQICLELLRRTREEVLADRLHLQPFNPAFFAVPLSPVLLQMSVRDTGIGIDPQECLRVFDKFYNAGDIDTHFTSTIRFGGRGVGLGLALVKGMVEIQGGMIWVESQGLGANGTAFHLLLPLPGEAVTQDVTA